MKMMAKAAASDADEVIFDLEDAVAPAQKETARAQAAAALRSLDFKGKVRAFRINGVGTAWWRKDLELAASADVVVIPKARSAEEVKVVAALLPPKVGLEVLIETAAGLVHAYEIAKVDHVQSLIFGVADFAADLGARDFKGDFNLPRMQMLIAARAASVDAIDSVTVQVQDAAQCARDAENAARMGFDGKWAIHPSQLEPIHRAFNPTPDELAAAQRIVDAYAKGGRGAMALDGEMVDAATIAVAQKRLAVARRAGLLKS
jgi:citrate lyase subunit beta/citryl-CoA lyase